jgi:2-dehydro-3-deoxyphosphogluconate aldolase/(4S)-4-hydroxy-2-oxoglutarate aldolase
MDPTPRTKAERLRASAAAEIVREARLIAILRRISPTSQLVALVRELADGGVRVFEITFDAPSAADDLAACRQALEADGHGRYLVGAGTIRTPAQLGAAHAAGADFGVSPVLDPSVLGAALAAGLPFVPGAYSPTEVDAAWRAGATFVKLFPASSLGPRHVRELRGPMPEIETIATGGIDVTNAGAFLAAGAVAVGIGSALVRGDAAGRRALVAAVMGRA